jgi:ABC-type dipeptide/oligopeptide/nickel transport system permease subunit
MIGRFLRSRGATKFRKNRLAMLSMAIILAYIVLGLWIAGTNAVNGIGQRTGAFSFEGRPVLGLFLTSKTLEVVGPKEVPGFGLEPRVQTRLASVDELIQLARRGLAAADQVAEGSGRSTEDAFADVAWPDRPFAEVSLDEFRERLGGLEREFERLVEVRRGVQQLDSIPVYAQRIAERRTEVERLLDAGVAGESLLVAVEELGFALEEFGQSASNYAVWAGPDDPIAQLDPSRISDAGTAMLDVPVDDPVAVRAAIPGPDVVDGVLAARAEAARTAVARVDVILDELEPAIDRVFPEPEGLRGFIYAFKLFAGTDAQGRSILIRAMYSSYVAIQVGLVTALFAVIFGGIFGAAAAFIGGPLDHVFNWVYSMITSIPYLVLLAVLSFLFLGSAVEGTLIPLYVAFGVTYWVGPGRVIRGEAMKIKELEYVQATTAMGFGRLYILLKHVIPNTSHLLFINFSLLFIAAIKGEVILTFLGLGLKNGASWGIMIEQSKSQVVNDFFWQIGTATFFMFLLVLAFNIFTDALQDAFDPKHVS